MQLWSRSLRAAVFSLLVVFAPTASAASLCNCDVIWEANKRIDGGLRSKSESLVGPAKDAFIEAMDYLFSQKLTPFLDKVDGMAAARLNQVQGIVDNAEKGIHDIIDHAATTAEKLADRTVEQIKQQIIKETFAEARILVDDIDAKLNAIIDKIDCTIRESRDAVIEWVRSQGQLLPNLLDVCYRINGYYLGAPRSDDYLKIYRIRQCQLEQELAASKTAGAIMDNYARLAELGNRFGCIMNDASSRALMERDSEGYRRRFHIWFVATKD